MANPDYTGLVVLFLLVVIFYIGWIRYKSKLAEKSLITPIEAKKQTEIRRQVRRRVMFSQFSEPGPESNPFFGVKPNPTSPSLISNTSSTSNSVVTSVKTTPDRIPKKGKEKMSHQKHTHME